MISCYDVCCAVCFSAVDLYLQKITIFTRMQGEIFP